jgi:esterase/lipase superfamily enzyme
MSNATFAYTYSFTNRAYPFTYFVDSTDWVSPLSGSGLYYYMANGNYDSDSSDYNQTTASAFISNLTADLQKTVDGTGRANLVVYIHGLGNTYSDGIAGAANLGSNLQAAGYGGLVVGFSWPSYSELVAPFADYYATAYPPANTSGTIRDNINGSVASFLAVLAQLQSIKVNNNPVNISVICHSEGNFMLLWGMSQYPRTSPPMNHAIMLAADISAAMLQTGQKGSGITANFKDVNVYFSGGDADVTYSNYEFFDFHFRAYPSRLGLVGPFSYPSQGGVPKNVTGIDCSQVTINLGGIQYVHSSYMSLPSTIADMHSVLTNSQPTGRTLYPGSSYPWYYLNAGQAVPAGIVDLWSQQIPQRPTPRAGSILGNRVCY